MANLAQAGGESLAERLAVAEAAYAAAKRDAERMRAFSASIAPLSMEALYAMQNEYAERAEQAWGAWSHKEQCYCVEEMQLIYTQMYKRWHAGEFGPSNSMDYTHTFNIELPANTKLGQAMQEWRTYALPNPLKISAALLDLRAGRVPAQGGPRIKPERSPGDEGMD